MIHLKLCTQCLQITLEVIQNEKVIDITIIISLDKREPKKVDHLLYTNPTKGKKMFVTLTNK